MAFKQIKFISQEDGKGYVFPDLSLVLGDEFEPIGFAEDLKDIIGISINTQISKFENFIEFFGSYDDNLFISLTPNIVKSTNPLANLSDNINISISTSIIKQEEVELFGDYGDDVFISVNTNIIKQEDFVVTLSDNTNISINTNITQTIDNVSLSEISSDGINISLTSNIVKFDCPPSGQLLSTYCSGTTLYGTYTNGSCGTYNQVIETNSTSCGYTPPPDPFVVRAKSNVGNPVVQITTPNVQFQNALTQTYQVIDNQIAGDSTYSITVNAPQTITIGSDTYTFESWTLNGTGYGGTSRTFSGLNSDSDLEARYLFTPPPPF